MKKFNKIVLGAAAGVIAVSGTAGATAAVIHSNAKPAVHVARVAADPQTNPESLFVPITPCRIIDTRKGGGIMKDGKVRNFYVAGTLGFPAQGGQAGGCGVPLNATAVSVSFKVVRPTDIGFLHVWPDATNEPTATVLSWPKGASIGDNSTLPISSGPGLNISARLFTSNADLTADVFGYYAPQIQALIGGDGTISAGTSRVVSVSHGSAGSYAITLDRPARQCSINATAFNLNYIATAGLSSKSTPNNISVIVTSLSGTLTDHSFFLQVSC